MRRNLKVPIPAKGLDILTCILNPFVLNAAFYKCFVQMARYFEQPLTT
jgi:hypothetical protein